MMPCYTPPHAYCEHVDDKRENALCDTLSAIKELDKQNKLILENLQDKLDYYIKNSNKVTDMLCRVLTEIGKMHFKECGAMTNLLEDDIKEWWEKHKEWDKKRKENEK